MSFDLSDTGEVQTLLNVLHRGKVQVMTRSQLRE